MDATVDRNFNSFLEKAKEIHGDKYDYSKVKYLNSKTKVTIICKTCGFEFTQTPNSHLSGHGCCKCASEKNAKAKNMGLAEFLKKAKEVHGDRYDYSMAFYTTAREKIGIICHEKDKNGKEHGLFWQEAYSHLNGCGCPKCKRNFKKTKENFLEKAKEIHGDKYDYSNVEYVNNRTKVCIICPEHGEFWQMPDNHLHGCGCPKCGFEKTRDSKFMSEEMFLRRATIVHNGKYDYSKVKIRNGRIDGKVCIVCPIHGEFWQAPYIHLHGCGCPKCRMSIIEKHVMVYLEKKIINYEYQKTFKWLKTKTCPQTLDFYLPDYNVAIECQGKQHFEPVEFFGGEENFNYVIERDERKRILCEENGVRIEYINYNENYVNKLQKILSKYATTNSEKNTGRAS